MSEVMNEPIHQTVEWAIEQLKQYPPKAQLRFATDFGNHSCWASDYEVEGCVFIDVEEL
jgi:hypothetical protein